MTESMTGVDLAKPLRIGGLEIPNRVILSPLAGVSDVPFRRICAEMGAGLTFVEMLLSNSLRQGSPRTAAMLARHPDEAIVGVQLTGPTAESVAEGVAMLDGQPFEIIDINMGCPVRKIVARGSGSAILKDPERVTRTIELAKARTRRPLSAKIRLGYTPETRNVEEVVRRLAGAGADMITIHGRTRSDDYAAPVDYAGIAAGVAAARAERGPDIVVVGNGDVFDPGLAGRMVWQTGCDAVLVSRGSLGNPWVFRQILVPGTPHPTPIEWREVLMRHLGYHLEHYGESEHAVAMFRKHLLWYVGGFRNMRRLRGDLTVVRTSAEIARLVDRCLEELDPAARRFESDQRAGRKYDLGGFDPKFDMDRVVDRPLADVDAVCE